MQVPDIALTWKALSLVAGAIAAGLGALGAVVTYWPQFGWQTPERHYNDVNVMMEARAELENSLSMKLDGLFLISQRNHEQWLCDEKQEELDDLLRQIDAEGGSAILENRVLQIQTKMQAPVEEEGLACSRFDD